MFLQVGVVCNDSQCLLILWREDPEQRIEVDRYLRHVFGRRVCQILQVTLCINWRKITLHTTKKLAKSVLQRFYMDDTVLKSVKKNQKTTEIYKRFQTFSAKLDSIQWITSDEEVNSQIPETDKSTKLVKILRLKQDHHQFLDLTEILAETVS